MIDLQTAIDSGNVLWIRKAILQRKTLRKEKLDLIASLQSHDYSKAISALRASIKLDLQNLKEMEERQRLLPKTIETIQRSRQSLTREIALLNAHAPKDVIGKLAKKLADMDHLSYSQKEGLLRLLLNDE